MLHPSRQLSCVAVGSVVCDPHRHGLRSVSHADVFDYRSVGSYHPHIIQSDDYKSRRVCHCIPGALPWFGRRCRAAGSITTYASSPRYSPSDSPYICRVKSSLLLTFDQATSVSLRTTPAEISTTHTITAAMTFACGMSHLARHPSGSRAAAEWIIFPAFTGPFLQC